MSRRVDAWTLNFDRRLIIRVDEKGDLSEFGDHFMQQLYFLLAKRDCEERYACGVPARPVEAGNKANSHRIRSSREYDRNGPGSRQRGAHPVNVAPDQDERDLMVDEIGCHCRHSIKMTIRPAILNAH